VVAGTLAGYKIGFLAPNGNIYLPPHAVNQGCALITPTPTGATFSTTAITGVSTGQVYGNDWIGGVMFPDGILNLIPFDASYNNTPGIAELNTNTNVFRSNPYTAGNTTNFNLQFMSGTMAPDGNMYITPYSVATGGAVNLYFFNPITKLMVAYPVSKPTAERFSAAILAPNGNIYGVAITGPAQACMIDPAARRFTTIGSNATVQYRGLVYGGNGSIYMIPNANATGIGILNTTTNTITANAIPGGLGYYGGVLGPDGNIYCIPSTATNIGVINTRTNTFSTLGSVTANSYGSAVLAPNGNIYLIPFGASGIGMITFTGLNMLPSTSFCLSPYVNKGFFTQ
jgi:streptogramin lyase